MRRVVLDAVVLISKNPYETAGDERIMDDTKVGRGTCENGEEMARPAKIKTPFPTVLETATRLGVSEHDAIVLSEMAERSEKTGTFIIPGVGRLVRVNRKSRIGRNPATGEAIKIPAKKVVKFRVAKAAKDAIVAPKKK
jgi:nucleoid DNA-binding protein